MITSFISAGFFTNKKDSRRRSTETEKELQNKFIEENILQLPDSSILRKRLRASVQKYKIQNARHDLYNRYDNSKQNSDNSNHRNLKLTAIVSGNVGTAKTKLEALKSAGVHVVYSPRELAAKVAELL